MLGGETRIARTTRKMTASNWLRARKPYHICSRRWANADPPTGRRYRNEAPARPKLVVLLVVDQMRGDYVTNSGINWTKRWSSPPGRRGRVVPRGSLPLRHNRDLRRPCHDFHRELPGVARNGVNSWWDPRQSQDGGLHNGSQRQKLWVRRVTAKAATPPGAWKFPPLPRS